MIDEVAYKNPIDRWYSQEAVIQANGGIDNCRKYAAIIKGKCPLDYKTDEPIPAWVVDLLRAPHMSYKGRIRTLMAHAEDIYRYRKQIQSETTV